MSEDKKVREYRTDLYINSPPPKATYLVDISRRFKEDTWQMLDNQQQRISPSSIIRNTVQLIYACCDSNVQYAKSVRLYATNAQPYPVISEQKMIQCFKTGQFGSDQQPCGDKILKLAVQLSYGETQEAQYDQKPLHLLTTVVLMLKRLMKSTFPHHNEEKVYQSMDQLYNVLQKITIQAEPAQILSELNKESLLLKTNSCYLAMKRDNFMVLVQRFNSPTKQLDEKTFRELIGIQVVKKCQQAFVMNQAKSRAFVIRFKQQTGIYKLQSIELHHSDIPIIDSMMTAQFLNSLNSKSQISTHYLELSSTVVSRFNVALQPLPSIELLLAMRLLCQRGTQLRIRLLDVVSGEISYKTFRQEEAYYTNLIYQQVSRFPNWKNHSFAEEIQSMN